MKTGKTVLGAMAGLAIGAIAGILLAPEKGSKTRKQIMKKGDHYADEGKSKFNKFRNSLTKKLKRTKKDAEKLGEKGKVKYNDAKKDAKKAASDFKHSVS
ncbi:MAG: YtxH domain-containing protein [Bacteroidota bacterium]